MSENKYNVKLTLVASEDLKQHYAIEGVSLQFSGKLPMIVFTEKGWVIEREQYTDEFIRQWDLWIAKGYVAVDRAIKLIFPTCKHGN